MTMPEKLWHEYAKLVYPEGMTSTQEHHVRAAFVAGLKGSLIAVNEFATLPEPAAVASVEQFNRDVCKMAGLTVAESLAETLKTKPYNPKGN